MKILHVNFAFVQGGIDNMMNDIMYYQLNEGNEVSLLIINDKLEEEVVSLLPRGINFYRIGRPPSSKNPYYVFKTYYLINKVIRPDIIHCHNGDIAKFIKFDRHPRILTVHAMNLSTKNYGLYGHICCISETVKKNVLRTFVSDNISVIYNGVNFNIMRKKTQDRVNRLCNIVVVGRLNHIDKGQDVAINAIKILCQKYKDEVMLHLIGNGPSISFLKQLASELSLENEIKFIGSKSRDWIYNHLCEYDLLVVPSRYEGFGLTIVEGFAAGLPVLASDIDAPMEILHGGKYGFIFKNNNSEDLAKKIHFIITMNHEQFQEKMTSDINYVKQCFPMENLINQYNEIYKKMQL